MTINDAKMTVRTCWLLLWVLLTISDFSGLRAQTRPASGTAIARVVVKDDGSPMRIRYPRPDKLSDLQKSHDYQYGRDVPPPQNPLARFWDWLMQKISSFLSSKTYTNVGQYIVLAAIAGLVIYLLRKAEVLGFLFPKKAQSGSLDYENVAEDIHGIDFDVAIEEALGQRNFRLAVRLLYLQTLKRLSDTNRIDYKPEKTNRQYVYELASSPDQADFEQLTRQFEFVWYGNFPIDETRFTTLRSQFNQFSSRSVHHLVSRSDSQ